MDLHRLGFQSHHEEVGPVDLPVSGRWPAWLDGALLRIGPALFEVGRSRYRHWFDGLAMLYRFGFADGRVRYANRFLRSRGYEAARAQGRIVYDEFGTCPDTGLLGRLGRLAFGPETSHNANVNVVACNGHMLALTESVTPIAFDAETLATLGPEPLADGFQGQIGTAHPHADARRGLLVSHLLEVGRRCAIHVLEQPQGGGARRRIASVPVDRPSLMHSFGLTDRHVVLIEPPCRMNPLRVRFSLAPIVAGYRWQAGEPIRFRLVDRADGSVVTVEGEPCFAFHEANTFDDGDAVVIDLCAYPDAAILHGLGLEQLRGGPQAPGPRSRLVRYRLPKAGGSATAVEIASEPAELPAIAAAAAGRRYRSCWAASLRGPDSAFLDRLVRLDVVHGCLAAAWEQAGCFVGEPVLVPRPGGDGEADGVVLSLILDGFAGRSAPLALDAGSLEELARAELPHAAPFGFHGRHQSAAELPPAAG
jgi:beta,beta-carotene 9',10'-dioxygenase